MGCPCFVYCTCQVRHLFHLSDIWSLCNHSQIAGLQRNCDPCHSRHHYHNHCGGSSVVVVDDDDDDDDATRKLKTPNFHLPSLRTTKSY